MTKKIDIIIVMNMERPKGDGLPTPITLDQVRIP
jgi:hypothetical protein